MRVRRIWMTTLTVLCVLGLCACGRTKETADKQAALKAQGMEQALAGEYEEAVASYDEALSLAGMRAGAQERDIAAYKASALHYMGESQKAIDLCSAILDLKKDAKIYLTRGLLYKEAGNAEAAKADFEAALEMTSKKDEVMLGRLSVYMEDYDQAKQYLESAAGDGETEAIYWQAELYHQMGNEDYAATLYQSYLAGEEVTHTDAYEKLVSWQLAQNDHDAALSTIQDGLAAVGEADARQLLASEIAIYEQRRDFETARTKMEGYLEMYPDDEEAAREYIFLKTR